MSITVYVFTSESQYIRQYGQSFLDSPYGIDIDSDGYLFVVNKWQNYLSIFDPHGNYIHSIGELKKPLGVVVASDGSVWVDDCDNNRLYSYILTTIRDIIVVYIYTYTYR